MTAERSVLVAVPDGPEVHQLAIDVASAAARALKAEPGDRSDVTRYESLCVQLEACAVDAWATGAAVLVMADTLPDAEGLPFAARDIGGSMGRPLTERIPADHVRGVEEWLATGTIVVELRLPFEDGKTLSAPGGAPAPEPASRWEAPPGVAGSKAVEERFRGQVAAVVAEAPSTSTRLAVTPSGIHNRVITEVLYEFVSGSAATRTDAPIAYRDGSQATHPFPLRCLELTRELPAHPDLELRLALLSIRHTEMDAVVDGAWLRNSEVSRPRAAGQTDDFVYETSLKQLEQLTQAGQRTVTLHIYQTGLDTAVVGFYRAVVSYLLKHRYAVSVVPMFYAAAPGLSGEGAPVRRDALFIPGQPWTMGERQ